MQTLVLSLVGKFGYAALGALIFLENVFPPIPSEVILPGAGFLASTGALALPGAIAAATVGSLLGAYVLYALGRVLSEERLSRLLASKPARALGFEPQDVGSAVGWFRRHGSWTVLVCRCVPIVRSLISIPAGTSGMGLARFTLYTMLGSLAWNSLLCTVGFLAGSAWEQAASQASSAIDIASLIVVGAAVAVIGVWCAKRLVPRLKDQIRSGGEQVDG